MIFIEKDIELLRKETRNEYIVEVIDMFNIIERNGNIYATLDKEKYENAVMEDIRIEGIEEGKIVIAKSLKDKNYLIKEISEITGLTIE